MNKKQIDEAEEIYTLHCSIAKEAHAPNTKKCLLN